MKVFLFLKYDTHCGMVMTVIEDDDDDDDKKNSFYSTLDSCLLPQ